MNAIDNLITSAINDGIFPGAAISIGNKNGEIFRNRYGSRQLEPEVLPVEENTLYDLASLTKIISTTMVALSLVEKGKLQLSDTLGKFFQCPSDKQGITIHQIMTHTSGLPAHAPLYDLCKTPTDVYHTILEMPLLAQPGKSVVYSCLGFILLGKICEMAGNTTLDKLAQEIVFAPLGLKTMAYNPCNTSYNFATTEYCNVLGKWLGGTVHDENARFMGGVSGNAGLFACISDCAKVATMYANKGSGIITQALFEQAVQNHTPNCDEARGLGFAVKGEHIVSCGQNFAEGSYGHTGFTGTSIWVDAATSQYVVFLTNRVHPTRENNKLIAFRRVLHDLCVKEYAKKINKEDVHERP